MVNMWEILDIFLLHFVHVLCLTNAPSEKITKTLMLMKSGNETKVEELWELRGGFNDPAGEKHVLGVTKLFNGGTFRSREIDNWTNDTPSIMRMVVWNQHGDMMLTVVFDTHDSPGYRLEDWMTSDRIIYSSNDLINNNTAKVNFRYSYSQLSITKVHDDWKVWFTVWEGDKTNDYPEFLLAYSSLTSVNDPVMANPGMKKTSSAVVQLTVNVSAKTSHVKVNVPYLTPGDTSPLHIIGITTVLTDARKGHTVHTKYLLKYRYPKWIFKYTKDLNFKNQVFITDGTTTMFSAIRTKVLKIQFLKPKKIPKSVLHINLTYVTENTFFGATYLSMVGEWIVDNSTATSTVVNVETTEGIQESGIQTKGETVALQSSYNSVPSDDSDFVFTTSSQFLSTSTDTYNLLPQDKTPAPSSFSSTITTSVPPEKGQISTENPDNHYWTINYDTISSFDYFTQEMHHYSRYYTSDIAMMMSFPVSDSATYSVSSSKKTTTTTPVPKTTAKMCCFVCNTGSEATTEDPLSIAPREHDDLRLNKTCLSQYIRRRTSALDVRASAEGIGYLGAGILVLVIGLIVAIDVLNAFAKNKRQSKVCLIK